MESIIVIRDRYQITIPESIRRYLTWLSPGAVVKVFKKTDSLILSPYEKKAIDWPEVWRVIEKTAGQGKKTSLAEFILADRLDRR